MTRTLILALFLVTLPIAAPHASTFKFRLLADPTTLDWHLASTSVETPLMMNLMEGLMEVDANLKPKPCLAEKMTISKDQKTYTFKIRKNAKWSDGVVLKAQDFVEGWKRLLTPATAAPYAYLLYDMVGAEEFNKKTSTDFSKVGVVAKDDQTLVVTLKKPVAYFPYLTGFWPLFPIRKDVVAANGAAWTKPGKMVTVGPYVLEAFQNQTKIVMKANPNYWRKNNGVTEATAMIIKDSATALNVFKSGGIQMMQDFSPDDLKLARPMPEFKTFPYLKTHYLLYKVKGAATENRDLRMALSQAIDRKPIPSILNGSQKLASTFIPPKVVGYDAKMSLAFDVAKAKESLAKSGYDVTKPLALVARNSERPRILAQYIQSELKKNLGLKVEIELFDHKVFRSQITSQSFPMMMMVWAADYPDGDSFLGLFESNTGNNIGKFSNAKYDENMTRAREDWNTLKRDSLYKEAQDILQIREAAILPLFYEENEALVAKNIKGFSINPIGYFFIKDISIN
ncbi:MAG: peptide ABC transporter substrate-binding protein [Bdellovibrionales bacterium]|nr:peptide ABC transporter substrate-binding protein [Bdellovibrionales bacterium]